MRARGKGRHQASLEVDINPSTMGLQMEAGITTRVPNFVEIIQGIPKEVVVHLEEEKKQVASISETTRAAEIHRTEILSPKPTCTW